MRNLNRPIISFTQEKLALRNVKSDNKMRMLNKEPQTDETKQNFNITLDSVVSGFVVVGIALTLFSQFKQGETQAQMMATQAQMLATQEKQGEILSKQGEIQAQMMATQEKQGETLLSLNTEFGNIKYAVFTIFALPTFGSSITTILSYFDGLKEKKEKEEKKKQEEMEEKKRKEKKRSWWG